MDRTVARTIRRSDVEYPPLLEEIPDPPDRLFVKGQPLEASVFIGVVGTRRPTAYGLDVARSISAGLAKAGVTVVSGMAYGIDAAAHHGALSVGGETIAVLGSGIDRCYPRRHLGLFARIVDQGTVISEYPSDTEPLQRNFPRRNRIIAGMSLGVILVEGRSGGGAMITARLAGEYGRELFAMPGPVHSAASEGPHSLMRDGATVATCAEDVLMDLGMSPLDTPQQQLDLGSDEQVVLKVVSAHPLVLDAVAALAHMPASSAAAVLSRLEMRGLVKRYPGARYALSTEGSPFNRY